MVTSDVWPEVEMWPFADAQWKNLLFNPYLRPNRRNSYVLQEIGIGERDGDFDRK